jgi:hypothetical protein
MSELGTIKPLVKPTPIRPVNKDSAKKEKGKKKKDENAPNPDEANSEGHINEYI